MKTILVLAYYYAPQTTSGATRIVRFAHYLREFGYRATVISAGEARHAVRISTDSPEPLRAARPSTVAQMQTAAFGFGGRLLREYSERLAWAPAAVEAGATVLAGSPVSAILSSSPPLAAHIAACRLSRHYGVPWIADFRDPFADNPFRQAPFRRFYDAPIERLIVRNAAGIIANTDVAADTWRKRYPEHREKIHLIWNGFDPEEEFQPQPPPARARKVLAHVGDIYGPRHPGPIVEALDRLIAAGRLDPDRFSLRLIGPIDQQSAIWNIPAFGRLAERNCIAYNNAVLPRAEALREIATADWLLLLDVGGEGRSIQVPAKIFDYLRAEHAVVAVTLPGSPAERILSKSGVSHACVYSGEPPAATEEKLLQVFSEPAAGHRPNEWFWTQFNARTQTGTLAELLDKVALTEGK